MNRHCCRSTPWLESGCCAGWRNWRTHRTSSAGSPSPGRCSGTRRRRGSTTTQQTSRRHSGTIFIQRVPKSVELGLIISMLFSKNFIWFLAIFLFSFILRSLMNFVINQNKLNEIIQRHINIKHPLVRRCSMDNLKIFYLLDVNLYLL